MLFVEPNIDDAENDEMQPAYLAVAGCGVCMMLPGTNAPARNGSSCLMSFRISGALPFSVLYPYSRGLGGIPLRVRNAPPWSVASGAGQYNRKTGGCVSGPLPVDRFAVLFVAVVIGIDRSLYNIGCDIAVFI